MLTKLLPEDIPRFWDLIKHAMSQSLPPVVHGDPETMNRIFSNLLAGGMDCFVSHTTRDDQAIIEGVIITSVFEDMSSGTKSLLMYMIYGYGKATGETWIGGYEYFSKHARSKGCTQIIGYTDVEKVKRIVEKLGGEARYSLVVLPLDSE